MLLIPSPLSSLPVCCCAGEGQGRPQLCRQDDHSCQGRQPACPPPGACMSSSDAPEPIPGKAAFMTCVLFKKRLLMCCSWDLLSSSSPAADVAAHTYTGAITATLPFRPRSMYIFPPLIRRWLSSMTRRLWQTSSQPCQSATASAMEATPASSRSRICAAVTRQRWQFLSLFDYVAVRDARVAAGAVAQRPVCTRDVQGAAV